MTLQSKLISTKIFWFIKEEMVES